MSVSINKYISFNSYNIEKENSRCYITNERLHTDFLLEDISADLWNILVKSNGNIKIIEEYAQKYQAEDSLDDFLDELYYFDLISYKNRIKDEENNLSEGAISLDRENSNKFETLKKEYLYENDFLYSLQIELPLVKSSNDDLSNLKKVIDDAKKIGVNQIVIDFKGEYLDKFFFEIANYIRDNFIALTLKINSESLYKTENMYEEINKLFLHRIMIPLYSTNDEINFGITGKKDLYKKTTEMVSKLHKTNNLVSIYFEQTEKNINEFDSVYEYIRLNSLEISCCEKTRKAKFIDIINFYSNDYLDDVTKYSKNFKQKLFVSKELILSDNDDYSTCICELREQSLVEFWNKQS